MTAEQTQAPAASVQRPAQAPEAGLRDDAARALGLRANASANADASREGTGLVREHGEEARNFATHVHQYHREYIALADQKAAFLFAAASAFLVYLYQKQPTPRWQKLPTNWSAVDFLAFLGIAGLAIGLVAAAAVIVPRLARTHRRFVFFLSIAEFESSADYAATISRESNSSLTQALLRHTYDLARVARAKYRALFVSIWASAIGFALSLVVLFL